MQTNGWQVFLYLTLAALPLTGSGTAPVLAGPHSRPDSAEKSRVVLAHPLPPLDGAHLAATVVEVTYGPGGFSTPHRHPCPVIVYVIEGAYRSRVDGGTDSIYTAGQSFYEAPNGVHAVSANASRERPVRFLASFTCDRATPLSTAVPESHDSSGRHK